MKNYKLNEYKQEDSRKKITNISQNILEIAGLGIGATGLAYLLSNGIWGDEVVSKTIYQTVSTGWLPLITSALAFRGSVPAYYFFRDFSKRMSSKKSRSLEEEVSD